MIIGRPRIAMVMAACLVVCRCAAGQTVGPDVVYSEMGSIVSYGGVDGVRGYALGSNTCNIGDQDLTWENQGTPGFTMNAYRLYEGQLKQIGMSWVKHACCAFVDDGCGLTCNGHGGDLLGVGCVDVYNAGFNGSQFGLGSRSGINAFDGTFSPLNFEQGNLIFRRLQIRESDLDSTDFPDALYFLEGVFVSTDDAAAGNATNNASHKQGTFDANFVLSEAGAMNMEIPAIFAWRDHANGLNQPDNSIEIREVDIPGEGRFLAASRATNNGDGTWRYTYVVFNLNSHRGGGSMVVPVGPGINVTNIGFSDVDYHSGDPYDNTDWESFFGAGVVIWATPQTHGQNPNSSAIRWGTMDTFWFDADAGPATTEITLGLFMPGEPSSVGWMGVAPGVACSALNLVEGQSGVSFSQRAFDGYVDPRSESTDGKVVNLGLDRFTFEFTTPVENLDGSPVDFSAFVISDTGGTPPAIADVQTEDAQTITVFLEDHLTLGEWTTISASVRSQCDPSLTLEDSIRVGFLPADINQDGAVSPTDLFLFRQMVNGLATPTVGTPEDILDTDRSGSVDPVDLFRLRQLINGVSPATQAWGGVGLPE